MDKQKIILHKSGKIEVCGNIPIYDEEGKIIYQSEIVKLCACKKSNKMPLCDGSHKNK